MKRKAELSLISAFCLVSVCLALANPQTVRARRASQDWTKLENFPRRHRLPETISAKTGPATQSPASAAGVFDVRSFGATGDGKTIDTAAINKAIEAAASAGGGTVRFPAGTYLCFSIHLRSNIALYLDHGAT